MESSVSSLPQQNIPWSITPTSRSLPTCTPTGMLVPCILLRTKISQSWQLKPLSAQLSSSQRKTPHDASHNRLTVDFASHELQCTAALASEPDSVATCINVETPWKKLLAVLVVQIHCYRTAFLTPSDSMPRLCHLSAFQFHAFYMARPCKKNVCFADNLFIRLRRHTPAIIWCSGTATSETLALLFRLGKHNPTDHFAVPTVPARGRHHLSPDTVLSRLSATQLELWCAAVSNVLVCAVGEGVRTSPAV